jgi:hypothetical protein
MSTPPELNPAQQRVIDLLGKGGERPELPHDVGQQLHDTLEDELSGIAPLVSPEDQLWVNKHALASVHTCEANHLATVDAFTWSVQAARGSVSHKAIELWVHWRGTPTPMDLVDEALARLVDGDRPLERFLGALTPGEQAELRSVATERVTAFVEQFPRLKREWVPVTESPARHDLLGGGVVLAAKTDLTLGHVGEKVIIDLKSGRANLNHREDLRYYALVETLKMGRAPRKIATYYLESARLDAEDVTADTLRAAVLRTVDGTIAMAELRAGRPAGTRPGPACHWCPAATACTEGSAFLAEQEADRW